MAIKVLFIVIPPFDILSVSRHIQYDHFSVKYPYKCWNFGRQLEENAGGENENKSCFLG